MNVDAILEITIFFTRKNITCMDHSVFKHFYKRKSRFFPPIPHYCKETQSLLVYITLCSHDDFFKIILKKDDHRANSYVCYFLPQVIYIIKILILLSSYQPDVSFHFTSIAWIKMRQLIGSTFYFPTLL